MPFPNRRRELVELAPLVVTYPLTRREVHGEIPRFAKRPD
jgi:hypothetical protein